MDLGKWVLEEYRIGGKEADTKEQGAEREGQEADK